MRPSLHLQHNTLRSMSPVIRAMQVMRHEGARWVAEASFNRLDRRVRVGVQEGLFGAPAGSLNTVRIWDWQREFLGDAALRYRFGTRPFVAGW
jgi:hypothetical protein